ncbi:MAG: radical SAM protein [Acidobacteria bacterium]|nr:radical SAM protein [Acidobacteriota bacterium]
MNSPVLEQALELASASTPAPKTAYVPTLAKKITRRGILWLGQTCNLRCHFCYFLDRIEDERHPEHAFMSLDKAKEICRTLVDYYGNNSIDLQGGEPTLWPKIYSLVEYNASIGLASTIISNMQVLSSRATVARFKNAGLRDVLVSLQGLGPVYDGIVGQQGAHVRQMKALDNLQAEGVPFRLNTVLSRPALEQVEDIATLAIQTGAEVVNFLGFNPFNDQQTGKRSSVNVPRYAEIAATLDAALDTLAAAGVEANVRYLPFCMVAERHRKSIYNFGQIPYDLHENDFAGWSWTDLPAQRAHAAELTPPFQLGQRLELGPLRAPLRRLAKEFPTIGNGLHQIKQHVERRWASEEPSVSIEELYQRDARMRAREYTGYRHVAACSQCDARNICDGFYGDYADLFGEDEARPIQLGGTVTDPQHFSKEQEKRVHPDDLAWLTTP